MILRPYQQAASAAVDNALAESDDNPCVVLPTGSGKTPLMADMIRRYLAMWPGTRIIVVAHVAELVDQNARKLAEIWPEAPMGVYAASMGLRQRADVTFASIQSVYRRAAELGPYDLIFVDEAHRIPVSGDGMYRRFIEECRLARPHVRVVGMTATPYRMGSGLVCGPENVLHSICYEAGVGDLIRDGYLCPLVSKSAVASADTSGVKIVRGEYDQDQLSAAVDRPEKVDAAVSEALELSRGRNARLWFAANVKHATHVSEALAERGVFAPVIHAGTPRHERDNMIGWFRERRLADIVNINVLSEGFDAPHIDTAIMLRPTKSAGMYYQQVGRGLRISPHKADCLVLDFANNIDEHGPIDTIRIRDKRKRGQSATEGAPTKVCPECRTIVHLSTMTCPGVMWVDDVEIPCGYEWPRPEVKHERTASDQSILSEPPQVLDVACVDYQRWSPKDPAKPPTMRVSYSVGIQTVSEWICFEHQGYPREKAGAWWRWRAKRGSAPPDVPLTVKSALAYIREHGIREPTSIKVKTDGRYPEIKGYGWSDDTERQSASAGRASGGDDRDPGSTDRDAV